MEEIVSTYVAVLVLSIIAMWVTKKIKEWMNLPPGPWGLPIVGYLPFIDRHQPHITMTKLSKKYGPIYGLNMGSIYTVVLTDHTLIRNAFANDVFSGRAPLYLTHGIMHGNGIICAEGELWRDQRKLITMWLKSFGMGKHSLSRQKLEQRIALCNRDLIETIEKSKESSIDLFSFITNALGNAVNDIIFGFKFPRDDKTYHWLRKIQEEGCHELGVSGVVNFLPFVRFFSPSIRNTMHILQRGQTQTHRLYESIVAKRRKLLGIIKPKRVADHLSDEHPDGLVKCITYSKDSSKIEEHYFNSDVLIPSDHECILDKFLIEQKRRFEAGEKSAQFTTDEQLYYLLADMFGAGLDTTSVTLAWFFLYIALNQDIQENVRKEIISVYPDEEYFIDHARLPYLMATICETQRIRSIVPLGIPHGSMETAYLGGFQIPKGTMIVPLQWALHMDPVVWEDPESFRPSRFLDADGSLLKPRQFIPFQTGKRMCPGDELSRMLTSSLVVQILRRRRIRLASEPPSTVAMQGSVGVTLTPPHVFYHCDPNQS
uniref:Cytochrome P450 CYP306A1 n=1 Tax=Zygaena filipendulae TaxID=287375 RepID=A0A286MXN3_9NEOP|nr:cytochrome P450 CYP306A1 [Zygaena filipendulae]